MRSRCLAVIHSSCSSRDRHWPACANPEDPASPRRTIDAPLWVVVHWCKEHRNLEHQREAPITGLKHCLLVTCLVPVFSIILNVLVTCLASVCNTMLKILVINDRHKSGALCVIRTEQAHTVSATYRSETPCINYKYLLRFGSIGHELKERRAILKRESEIKRIMEHSEAMSVNKDHTWPHRKHDLATSLDHIPQPDPPLLRPLWRLSILNCRSVLSITRFVIHVAAGSRTDYP